MRFAAPLALLLFAGTLAAAPAPWYLWSSTQSDGFICAQVPPGDGWQRVRGPFRDAVCKKQGLPG
ncbi:hypothetical protein CKO20_15500 [Rhodocyclus tenuis]|nr:hypothetical protein [Rhodocyclus tenuis]